MSTALAKLKQQTEQHAPQPLPETSDAMLATLTSVLDLVEALCRQQAALTEGQKKLAGFVRAMDEQQTLQMERLTQVVVDRASTSPPSEPRPSPDRDVVLSLNEIESTLTEFVSALDGRQLRQAASTLITEASRNRADTNLAIDRAAKQVALSAELVKRADGAALRTERQTRAAIQQITAAAADTIAGQSDQKLTALEARTEKLIALVSRIEGRQLWTAAGALCLALLPAATVVLGGILLVAGVVFGWEVALNTEAATWLRWVRGLGAAFGTGCALVGLAAAVRWVAGHVSAWRR